MLQKKYSKLSDLKGYFLPQILLRGIKYQNAIILHFCLLYTRARRQSSTKFKLQYIYQCFFLSLLAGTFQTIDQQKIDRLITLILCHGQDSTIEEHTCLLFIRCKKSPFMSVTQIQNIQKNSFIILLFYYNITQL